jgi:hypothetical protein
MSSHANTVMRERRRGSGTWTRPGAAGRALRGAARRVLAASDAAMKLMRPILEQHAAERAHALGRQHPDALAAENHLALSYLAEDQPDVAADMFDALAADCAQALGRDHPDTLVVRGNLAAARLAAGQAASAAVELAGLVADRSRVLGDGHPSTVNARIGLAMARLSAGQPDSAAAVLEPTLDRLRVRHGTRHPLTRFCSDLLADARAA